MAAKLNFSSRYPRDYEYGRAVYYTQDISQFRESVENPVLISEGITQYGLLMMESMHTPISENSYRQRLQTQDRIYNNSEVSIIKPN